MPRYFFHVIDGKDLPDHEGTVLANADEARAEAIMLSGAMLKESASTFWNNGQWHMRDIVGINCPWATTLR